MQQRRSLLVYIVRIVISSSPTTKTQSYAVFNTFPHVNVFHCVYNFTFISVWVYKHRINTMKTILVLFYYKSNPASVPQVLGDGCSQISSATRRLLLVRPGGSESLVINIALHQKKKNFGPPSNFIFSRW